MPSIEFSNSVSFSSYGYQTISVRVNYIESYNYSNNITTVTLSSVEAKTSSLVIGSSQFNGDGVSFSANNSSWTNVTSFGHSNQVSLTTYYQTIGNTSSGAINVAHNASGAATIYIKFSASIAYTLHQDGSSTSKNTGTFSNSGSKSLTTRVVALTVYPNGGSWNNSSANQSFSQAPSTTKTISDPSRTGYNFTGWTPGGGGSLNGTTYTFGSSNGTLTAQWSKNSYTLTTQASPSDAGTITDGGSVGYGDQVELTATPASTSGYTIAFSSWGLSGTGNLSSVNTNPTTYTMGAGDATVTGYFTSSANTYYVKFNGNGATGGGMSDQQFTYDASPQALSANQFVRLNYDFLNWNTKADGTGITYTNGQSVQNLAPSGTFNLYAIWKLRGFNVDYDANGHGTAPTAQVKVLGQDLQLAEYIPVVAEDSALETYSVIGDANGGTWVGTNGQATSLPHHRYTQIEWNTQANGSGQSYEERETYTVDSALYLYAIWEDSETRDYTYTIPSGIPTFSETRIVVFDKNGGDALTAPSMAYGYRDCPFEAWYTEPSGGIARDSQSQILASETVYAHYEDTNFSTIITPAKNQCTKQHYELLGWAADSSATVPDYAPNISIQPAAETPIGFLLGNWSGGASGVTTISENISAWSSTLTVNDYFNLMGEVGIMYDGTPMTAYIEDSFYWLWPDDEPKVYTFEIMGETVTLTLTQTTITLTTETSDPVVDLTFLKGGFMGQYLYAVWGAAGEVYIGGDKYKILIYDGTNWNQYQAYIGDGSNWVPY